MHRYLFAVILLFTLTRLSPPIHEFGHALFGTLVGAKVTKIQIWGGKTLGSWNFAGIELTVGRSLFAGSTHADRHVFDIPVNQLIPFALGGGSATLLVGLALGVLLWKQICRRSGHDTVLEWLALEARAVSDLIRYLVVLGRNASEQIALSSTTAALNAQRRLNAGVLWWTFVLWVLFNLCATGSQLLVPAFSEAGQPLNDGAIALAAAAGADPRIGSVFHAASWLRGVDIVADLLGALTKLGMAIVGVHWGILRFKAFCLPQPVVQV